MINMLLFMAAVVSTMTAFGLLFARHCSKPIPIQRSSALVAERRDVAHERAALKQERAKLEQERAALDAYADMLDSFYNTKMEG